MEYVTTLTVTAFLRLLKLRNIAVVRRDITVPTKYKLIKKLFAGITAYTLCIN